MAAMSTATPTADIKIISTEPLQLRCCFANKTSSLTIEIVSGLLSETKPGEMRYYKSLGAYENGRWPTAYYFRLVCPQTGEILTGIAASVAGVLTSLWQWVYRP
jgi:hypothetical protein